MAVMEVEVTQQQLLSMYKGAKKKGRKSSERRKRWREREKE